MSKKTQKGRRVITENRDSEMFAELSCFVTVNHLGQICFWSLPKCLFYGVFSSLGRAQGKRKEKSKKGFGEMQPKTNFFLVGILGGEGLNVLFRGRFVHQVWECKKQKAGPQKAGPQSQSFGVAKLWGCRKFLQNVSHGKKLVDGRFCRTVGAKPGSSGPANSSPKIGAPSGMIRANRFARFARIGNSSDSGESAWRAIKIVVSIAKDSRESIRANRVANRPCH